MKTKVFIVIILLLVAGFFLIGLNGADQENVNEESNMDSMTPEENFYEVNQISHASFVLNFGGLVIFNDPVGEAASYQSYGTPDLILLSDIHGDHLSTSTLEAVVGDNTAIIAPQAVADELPEEILVQTTVMQNGDTDTVGDLGIEAIPMYNIPETEDAFHPKGRGNGYVLTYGERRIYIAGDTSNIPELQNLTDIDVAFMPMNLPYTMGVEEAAEAVLEFNPARVYPYHYRGADGQSDVNEFARLVQESYPDIEVILLDWYSE